MNKWIIKFQNTTTSAYTFLFEDCLSFAEAARAAYMQRKTLGFDWEIISIIKEGD